MTGESGCDHEVSATARATDTSAHNRLTRDQEIGHYIDIWKQAVEVQMHFNDIEWRIRGLALTVATFVLGAAGVAAKDATQVGRISLGALVIAIGLLLWYGFYFVDRHWYHPLLKASVAHGTRIEDEIKNSLPEVGITATITAGSAYETKGIVKLISRRSTMQSDDKLVWFYRVGAIALTMAAVALQVGLLMAEPEFAQSSSPTPSSPTSSPESSGVAGP